MASTAWPRGPLLGHLQFRRDLVRRLDQLRLGEQVAQDTGVEGTVVPHHQSRRSGFRRVDAGLRLRRVAPAYAPLA